MSDETAKAHQELATRNSRAAVKKADDTRNELLDRINHLERLVVTDHQKLVELEKKYNLLLTARFDGRSTD